MIYFLSFVLIHFFRNKKLFTHIRIDTFAPLLCGNVLFTGVLAEKQENSFLFSRILSQQASGNNQLKNIFIFLSSNTVVRKKKTRE